jgi:hypothetical protein
MDNGHAPFDGSSRELLAERGVRSSELALHNARSRLAQVGDELLALRGRVADVEQELHDAAVEAENEPAMLRAELELEARARRAAEQEAHAARVLAEELSAQLAEAMQAAAAAGDDELELAVARRRIEELEGELELVGRRAAEFEQLVRMAVDSFWRELNRVQDRQTLAVDELASLRRIVVERTAENRRPAPAPAHHHEVRAVPPISFAGPKPPRTTGRSRPPVPPATVEAMRLEVARLEAARLDEARNRLRAQQPPGPDSAPVLRWLRRRLRR